MVLIIAPVHRTSSFIIMDSGLRRNDE